jgi:hypothetical protein
MKLRKIGNVLGVIAGAAIIIVTSGVPASASVVSNGWNGFGGPADTAVSGACMVEFLTSRLSSDTPAYITAEAFQMGAPSTCSAALERSANGGKSWRQVGKVTLPPEPYGYTDFAITKDAYDGPGYQARACVWTSQKTLRCTPAVTLGAGEGTPASPALPASINQKGTSAGGGGHFCFAQLNSTTRTKQRDSQVDALFVTRDALCVGWIQVSADKGKKWTTVSPRVAFQGNASNPAVQAYLGPHPDGTGRIARVCVQVPAASIRVICSWTW